MSDELKRGLEGVPVAESTLSNIDGDAGRLVYRGYAIEDLARDASYEEVCYLLWHGHLPDRDELDAFEDDLANERAVDDRILATLADLAGDELPMAALRTAVSMFSAGDPDSEANPREREATLRKGRRVAAKVPTVLAAFNRLRNGEEPTEVAAETFDQALVLHADHGLNASTFTTMVIASTFADAYSAMTGGVGALSGPLHGGANQDVMEMLHEIDEEGADPVEFVADARENRENWRVPGWGHRVYNVKDPRADILQDRLAALGESAGETKWYDATTAIENHLREEGLVEKGIAPNVDFYSGSVYHQLGIPMDMYTPIFAMSRASGWLGHVLEYQVDNRLIRPRAHYTGPEDEGFVPIDRR